MKKLLHGPRVAPSLIEMARAGYFFCRRCQRVSGPRDGCEGEVFAPCELCGAAALEFRAGVLPPEQNGK